ncbi:MAG: hypothetical protein M3Z85_09045, partial [Acidobacteriota bacterium]|nr:hypothetical protein [Acidobacteriota bacterium]
LSLKIQKRYASGLSLLTSYTWSHTLDVWSTERNGNNGGPQDPLNWRPDYATSSASLTHAFLLSSVYELPFGHGKKYWNSGFASRVLGNWEWSGILGLYSGQPINVTLGFDNAGLGRAGGQRPNLIGDPFSGQQTRLRWFNTAAFIAPSQFKFGNFGRNVLRGPALTNFDTSLIKNFPIRERRYLQFRAEFFNAANLVNFNNPNTTFNSNNFGIITSAKASRSIQLSLKLNY